MGVVWVERPRHGSVEPGHVVERRAGARGGDARAACIRLSGGRSWCSAMCACVHPPAGRSMWIRCPTPVPAASRWSCAAWRAPSSAKTAGCATSLQLRYQVFFSPPAVRTLDSHRSDWGCTARRATTRAGRCVADHGGAARAARGAGAARPGRPAARPRTVAIDRHVSDGCACAALAAALARLACRRRCRRCERRRLPFGQAWRSCVACRPT